MGSNVDAEILAHDLSKMDGIQAEARTLLGTSTVRIEFDCAPGLHFECAPDYFLQCVQEDGNGSVRAFLDQVLAWLLDPTAHRS
jgi:hypothetical protein